MQEAPYRDPRPIIAPVARKSARPCIYYDRGNCAKGERCYYSHDFERFQVGAAQRIHFTA